MPLITLHTEDELIMMLKSGDKSCFDYLYDHYSTSLYTTILKLVKKEEVACTILHNAFVRMWQNAESLQPGVQPLYTWMLRNARLAIDEVMQNGKREQVAEQYAAKQKKLDVIGAA